MYSYEWLELSDHRSIEPSLQTSVCDELRLFRMECFLYRYVFYKLSEVMSSVSDLLTTPYMITAAM